MISGLALFRTMCSLWSIPFNELVSTSKVSPVVPCRRSKLTILLVLAQNHRFIWVEKQKNDIGTLRKPLDNL